MNPLNRSAKKIADGLIHPHAFSYDKGLQDAERHGGLLESDFLDMDETMEIFPVESGRYIFLTYMACPPSYERGDGRERAVILSHGHNRNMYFSLKYARIYYELGYKVLVFDHRGHANSAFWPCTMGPEEGADLAGIASHVRSILGPNAIIGVHGESMGAAAICCAMPELSKSLDFAVCDCAYTDFSSVLAQRVRSPKMRERIFAQAAAEGVSLEKVCPIDGVRNAPADFPVCFVQGGRDTLVTPDHLEQLYSAKQGKKDKMLFPRADHAHSIDKYGRIYRERIHSFLRTFVEE